ncbi:MAG: hypothetical protein CME71_04195 [Halobacteriovorax sp.]|nr:hypothetical protein [Halobacteriovorax sp.]|tara:strand:- start:620 stop:1348 length:729 start_codon:yes stop_codon:yes gene_type:complete
MKFISLLVFPIIALGANPIIDGVELGKEEKIKDVIVRSAEKSDSRIYLANYNAVFNGSFDKALSYVLDFPKRCNNSYRKERKLTEKDFECIYHNDNLIESQIIKDLKVKDENPNIVDRFVVKRRIWNKGLHSYNDLVTVTKETPKENEVRRLTVSYRLLKDDESKKLIDDPVPFNNAFYYTMGTYRMAETKDGKVTVEYSYETKTDHWFLTSSMIQGSIYSSIANGTRYAVDGIQGALTNGK